MLVTIITRGSLSQVIVFEFMIKYIKYIKDYLAAWSLPLANPQGEVVSTAVNASSIL
jgi:hypothetical protein